MVQALLSQSLCNLHHQSRRWCKPCFLRAYPPVILPSGTQCLLHYGNGTTVTLSVAMFDPAARHAQISQQGDAARQAELNLRDRRVSLTLTEWREHLLLFSEEVVDQQQSVPG